MNMHKLKAIAEVLVFIAYGLMKLLGLLMLVWPVLWLFAPSSIPYKNNTELKFLYAPAYVEGKVHFWKYVIAGEHFTGCSAETCDSYTVYTHIDQAKAIRAVEDYYAAKN